MIIKESSARLSLLQQLESCIVQQECFTLKLCLPNIGCWQLPPNSLCSSNAFCTWDVHPLVQVAFYFLGSEGNMGIVWQRRRWEKAVSKRAFKKRYAFLWVLKAAFLAWNFSLPPAEARKAGKKQTYMIDLNIFWLFLIPWGHSCGD